MNKCTVCGVGAIVSLAPSLAFPEPIVPEMDAGLVPLVLGLTLALVMLVKDRSR